MSGQVGLKSESTWGTAVTVDTFVPVLGADMSVDEGFLRSAGIRGNRRTRSPGRLGARSVSGSVSMELYNASMATLLKHAFGTVATEDENDPIFEHTFTPGDVSGKSMTVQVGITDTSGTTQPFTLSGAKIGGWSLSCNVGELAQFNFDYTAKDVATGTALASPSYAAGLVPFTFIEGVITVNGSPVASANAVTISAAKNLKTDRHVIGSRFIREQLTQDFFDFTTEITADFDGLTYFNLAAAATQVASVLTFDNGTDSLVITCSGQVIGDSPSLTNPGIESQTIRLEHSHGTSDASAITAVLTNAEASAA